MNKYNNHDSEIKHMTREHLIKESFSNIYLSDIKRESYNIFTLPSSNCKWENSIAKVLKKSNTKFHFDMVERDINTYQKAFQNMNTDVINNSNFLNIELDKFDFSSRKYDFVWFDIYSNISTNTLDIITKSIIKMTIRKDGYFALTLQKGRELDIDNLKKYFNAHELTKISKIRNEYLVKYIQGMLNINLVSIIDYQDNYHKRSTAMRLYIFKNSNVEIEPSITNINRKKFK
jgi:hypothetical protein